MHLHGHDFCLVSQDSNELPEPSFLSTIHVAPGGAYDVEVYGDIPGWWTFHDHKTVHLRNNGICPGGMPMVFACRCRQSSYQVPLLVVQ